GHNSFYDWSWFLCALAVHHPLGRLPSTARKYLALLDPQPPAGNPGSGRLAVSNRARTRIAWERLDSTDDRPVHAHLSKSWRQAATWVSVFPYRAHSAEAAPLRGRPPSVVHHTQPPEVHSG